MPACQNPMTACQNLVTLSQNQLPSYQNLITSNPEQLMLQNLIQNPFFTPNVNIMSNPRPCQHEIVLTKNQCNICQRNALPSNAINPSYSNRFLENPTMNTILNAQTRLYNQNGVEESINPCNVPNIVNNYIYVPPEAFMEDCKKDRYCRSNTERREKVNKRTGRRKNKQNKNDIDVQSRNEQDENELALSNDNNTEIKETKSELTNKLTVSDTRDVISNTHDVILDANINNMVLNLTEIESTLNEDKIADQNILQTEGTAELKEQKHNPIEYQAQMPNINTQPPVSNVYRSPCALVPMGNFYNSPCLPHPYVNTGVDNNANCNMLDQYYKFHSNDQNINEYGVRIFGSNSQNNAKFKDKHVTTDINKNNVTNGNVKPKRRNSQNKPATTNLNVNLKSRDIEEFVIRDFRRKFPNIPESIVRQLIYHTKNHFHHEQNTLTNQYPVLPTNFEQFYRTPFFNMPRNSKNGRRNSSKRNNRRRKAKSKNKNDTNKETAADTDTKVNNSHTNNNATTISGKYQEASNNINETKSEELNNEKTVSEYVPVTKVDNINVIEETNAKVMPSKSKTLPEGKENVSKANPDSKPSVKTEDTQIMVQHTAVIPETIHSITTPELGNEDIVQPMPMNGVDDYYPDFTVDNHAYFLSSMEDVHLKNLEDRYHYTTDRNLRFAESNRERRRFEQNNKNIFFKGSSADSNIFEYTTTERGKYKAVSTEITTPKVEQTTEAKVQFRTPPTLEKPDFKTKKITNLKTNFEDMEYKPEFTNKNINNDKVSIYSSTKTPQYNHQEKPSKHVSDEVPERRNIETVFAHSKVVKYGTNHEDTTSNVKGITKTNIPRNSEKERNEDTDLKIAYDGGNTVVYAKSISA